MSSRRPRRPDVTTSEAVGGVETLGLELHDYDERWVGIFGEHRDRIAKALTGVDVGIEHIGSTSVPGLAAKPIVDIVVTVEDITAEEDYLDALLAAGTCCGCVSRGIAWCARRPTTSTCTSSSTTTRPWTSTSSCAIGCVRTPPTVPSTRTRKKGAAQPVVGGQERLHHGQERGHPRDQGPGPGGPRTGSVKKRVSVSGG